jgi:outer membrane beta-barrel protein
MLLRTLLITCLGCTSYTSFGEESTQREVDIKPIVERKALFDDVLDTENFEIGVQAGLLSIEDFESSGWVSAHLAYHITEYFYVKARYGVAEAGLTSFEKLSNTSPLLTNDERELTYYGLNVGYNLMPGEIFIGKDLAFNSVFSVELGAGTTEFAGDDNFTVNISTNYRVFLNDWVAWDLGVSDYIFNTKITGETKTTHNLNVNTGIAVYF